MEEKKNILTYAGLKKYEVEKKTVLERVVDFEITDEESNNQAAELLKQLKPVIKNIEQYWKPLKESAKKAHENLCKKEKEMLEPLKSAEIELKRKMGNYILVQEEKAKLESEKIKKEQEEFALK